MAVSVTLEAKLSATTVAILADAPIGYWRLGDAVGAATAADSSIGAHAGTVVGTVTFGQPTGNGDSATGAAFGTSASGVKFASTITQPATPTIEARVMPTAYTYNFARIWCSSSGASFPMDLGINTSGQLYFYLNYVALTPGWIATGTSLPLNVFSHVALTWDGTTVRVYVNGTQIYSSATWSGNTLINAGSTTGDRGIGYVPGSPGSEWTGVIAEVALFSSPLSAARVAAHALSGWTDISADRAHREGQVWSVIGGGQGNSPGDVVANGGTFAFELNNAATNATGVRGCYSPNSATPRAGWGIDTPVRIGITVGANAKYYKFAGWVDQIVPLAGLYEDQVVQVVAVDWLSVASTALAAVDAQLGQRGDQLTATLAATITPAPFATSYDTGPDTYTYAFDNIDPQSTRALAVLSSIARSGLDRIYIKGDTSTGGVLRFESHSFRRSFTTDAFTLSDVGVGGLGLSALEAARRRESLVNQIRFTIHPRKVDAAATTILYALNIDATTVQSIAANGGTVTIWADYADPAQTAQNIAGTSMVAPVATTDYTFNSLANGSGTNLTASVSVTATFFAKTAKLVIVNSHATLAAFPTFLQLRGKGIYSYQALTAEAVQASTRPAALILDQPYQSVIGQAQATVDYLLSLQTAPSWSQVGAASTFCPSTDEAAMWTLVQAEVSTAFSLTETLMGFLGYPLWVNGWQVDIDTRDNMTFTFYGEPRDPQQYWLLGTAGLGELGNTTYLGPF